MNQAIQTSIFEEMVLVIDDFLNTAVQKLRAIVARSGKKINVKKMRIRISCGSLELRNYLNQLLPIVFHELTHTHEAEIELKSSEFQTFLQDPGSWEVVNLPANTKIVLEHNYSNAPKIGCDQISHFIQMSRFEVSPYVLEMKDSVDERFLCDYLKVFLKKNFRINLYMKIGVNFFSYVSKKNIQIVYPKQFQVFSLM